jgi:N6-L-threonylcarbamoyladenine synthase
MPEMLVLGLETSCDETSAAVLRDRGRDAAPEVLSNIILSQDEIHAPYGGVVPELASRQHIKSIVPIVLESLTRAGVGAGDVGLYAVTQGPGLIGSLLVGLTFAKGLAYYYHKPLIGVSHLEAHLEAAFLENPAIGYPVLGLLVSGGHTSLYFMREPLRYELIGRTRDDAAGEALDKVAKFLGLGYPGGPVIEKLGKNGDPARFPFGLPRTKEKSLDFSFSGLKTAALKHIKEQGLSQDDPRLPDFLASFEETIARALLAKVRATCERLSPASLILCGGVARNARLRTGFGRLAEKEGLPAFVPSPKLCTDNAAMVGALALKRFRVGPGVPLDLDLDAYPRAAC